MLFDSSFGKEHRPGDGRAGIGYLLKERVIDPAAFAEAVRQVWHGEAVLDPTIIERRSG